MRIPQEEKQVSIWLERSQNETWFSFSWVLQPDLPNVHVGDFCWANILEAQLLWAQPDKIRARWKALAQDKPQWALRLLQDKPQIQSLLQPQDFTPLLADSNREIREQVFWQAGHIFSEQ